MVNMASSSCPPTRNNSSNEALQAALALTQDKSTRHAKITMSQAQVSLQYLPVDVIVLIAQKLDMFDMICAKNVCRRWYNVIESSPLLWQHPHFNLVWDELFISYVPSPCHIIARLKGRSVRSLHFTGLTDISTLLRSIFQCNSGDGRIFCRSGFDMLYGVTRDLVSDMLYTSPENLQELIVNDWYTYDLAALFKVVAQRTRVDKFTVLFPSDWREITLLFEETQWPCKVKDFRHVNIITTRRSIEVSELSLSNSSRSSGNDRNITSFQVYFEPSLAEEWEGNAQAVR
jgi:hypothetical protein